MTVSLGGAERALLDRYIESVLLRFADGKYSLLEATEEFAQTFALSTQGAADFLEHVRGIVEAGDDA